MAAGNVKLTLMPEVLPVDRALAQTLPAGTLYAVGGRVRDELRRDIEGAEVDLKDLDYVVTSVSATDLEKCLSTLGSVDIVGASFSVFKVTIDGQTVDIALPRRERSVGSGHRDFEVESGPDVSLKDDLARRDFRMNMIARAIPSGKLVDPYAGEADIRAHRIDILADRTFEEDPLRMLRAAQFAARFGYTPSVRARQAMAAAAPLITTVSAERMADEFTKLFVLAERPSIGLELLRETGVLAHIWPELLEGVGVEQNEWHKYDVYRHSLESVDATPPGDLIVRLAALLHDVGKPRTKEGAHFYRHEQLGAEMAHDMLARLRFSNEVVQTVSHLVRQHMYVGDPELSDPALRRLIRRIGVPHLDRQFRLRAADISGSGLPKRGDANERFQARVYEEIARKPAFSVADLQIGGQDVIDTMVRKGLAEPGFRGDARVGEALRELFEQVTERPERNEPGTLRTLLEQNLDARRNAR